MRSYGKIGTRQYPNRLLESNNYELGRYGVQYDWDANIGITLNGSNVSIWKDKIQGLDWIQSTVGKQPLINVATINGNNSVYANSTNKRMNSVSSITLGNDYWLAWVFLDSNAGTTIGPHNTTGTVSLTPVRVLFGSNTSSNIGSFCSSKINTTTGIGTPASRYVVAGGTSVWNIVIFTRGRIFVNGVSQAIIGNSDYLIPVRYNLLFNSAENNNYNTTGYLTRFAIGNQALSDSSILELSDKLNSVYAIY
jgi:hypothetical protein